VGKTTQPTSASSAPLVTEGRVLRDLPHGRSLLSICFNLKHKLDGGKMVKKKGPKTIQGMIRKDFTGDGRKRLDTAVHEEFFGKKKRKG
jgi:hypothetical protein